MEPLRFGHLLLLLLQSGSVCRKRSGLQNKHLSRIVSIFPKFKRADLQKNVHLRVYDLLGLAWQRHSPFVRMLGSPTPA